MSQIAEDLKATYDYLETHGWCQGAFSKVDGRVCLDGALLMAIDPFGPNTTFVECSGNKPRRYMAAKEALIDHLPYRVDNYSSSDLWHFNDEYAESVEDVKSLLRKAIDANT